jgi:hypothetical protein
MNKGKSKILNKKLLIKLINNGNLLIIQIKNIQNLLKIDWKIKVKII